MFRNLSFAYKITSLPAIACLSLALILGTAWIGVQGSKQTLDEIESGYYASLELGHEMYRNLALIHRSFQDAAATADLDTLEEASMMRDVFLENLNARRKIPVATSVAVTAIEESFLEYFTLVDTTTRNLVLGIGDEEIFNNLQLVATQVASLQEALLSMNESDKTAVTRAFESARSSNKRFNQVMMLVAAVSALLLILTSVVIIRVVLGAMRSAVEGMGALAEGDLRRKPGDESKDEIGQMVRSVGDVTGTVNELAAEIMTLIDAVRAGRLDVRGDSTKFQGAYAELIENINKLIDAFVAPIETTSHFVERISRGDIPPKITEHYEGDFNRTKENLNTLVETLDGLVGQLAGVTAAARSGRLSERGDATRFSGVWGDLVGGVNETMEAVTLPIQEVSEVLSNIANGNLTTTISSNYDGDFAKLRDDVNVTVAKLTDVIGSIKGSSASVAGAANEMARNNKTLSVRTEAHVKNLKETANNMNAMTGTVRQNADHAREANELAINARDKARQGGEVVSTVVNAMEGINEASGKIADIINVIDEIAFQTNLLALNAAVEAARAGEQGRGFAVVASEVRVLAGRTATAAKEIAGLIGDSVAKVNEGSKLVDQSGHTLEEIIGAVGNVTEMISAIAEASNVQTQSISDVDKAMGRMMSMTQENASMVELANESTLSMGSEARQLNDMMNFFSVESTAETIDDETVAKVAS
jgi:methyl-accepting chemotaxis protein